MDKTLADYIARTMARMELDKQQVKPAEENPNKYEVYPEEDGTDRPSNPYSQV